MLISLTVDMSFSSRRFCEERLGRVPWGDDNSESCAKLGRGCNSILDRSAGSVRLTPEGSRKEQDAAADCALLEGFVGFGGFGERISAIDAHRDVLLLNPLHELLNVARIFVDPGKGIGAREKDRAFFLQTHDVEGRHVAADCP